MLASFEVALFEPIESPIHVFPGFFVLVLVLSVSGTRTRCGIFEYDYEYHFIEYEYEGSQNSATSKLAPQAHFCRLCQTSLATRMGGPNWLWPQWVDFVYVSRLIKSRDTSNPKMPPKNSHKAKRVSFSDSIRSSCSSTSFSWRDLWQSTHIGVGSAYKAFWPQ